MSEGIKDWIRNLPSTNYKAFISIWLSVAVVMIFTLSIALQVDLQTEAVYAVFIFLGGLVGADVTQFVMKRKTEIITPPAALAENTTTTTISTPTTPAKAVLSQADAQRVADAHDVRQREIAAASADGAVG